MTTKPEPGAGPAEDQRSDAPGAGAASSGRRRGGAKWAFLGLGAAAAAAVAGYMYFLAPPGVDGLGFLGAAGEDAPWRRFAVEDAAPSARTQSADDRGLIALVIAPHDGSLGSVAEIDAPLTVIVPKGGPAAHQARARGHEALLNLASAGRAGQPQRDADAAATAQVQSGLPESVNLERVARRIAEGDGYVGLAMIGDAEASADPTLLRSLYRDAREKGLVLLDGRASNQGKGYLLQQAMKGPSATVQVVIDAKPDPAAIGRALDLVERTAARRGACVALASARPETLAALRAWIARRDDADTRLAPLTAVVRARLDRP